MSFCRSAAILWAVFLFPCTTLAEAPRKLLLVGQGPDGHPVQTHEYLAGLRVLAACLKGVEGVEVTSVRSTGPGRRGPNCSTAWTAPCCSWPRGRSGCRPTPLAD